jgi:hypothetical protein
MKEPREDDMEPGENDTGPVKEAVPPARREEKNQAEATPRKEPVSPPETEAG